MPFSPRGAQVSDMRCVRRYRAALRLPTLESRRVERRYEGAEETSGARASEIRQSTTFRGASSNWDGPDQRAGRGKCHDHRWSCDVRQQNVRRGQLIWESLVPPLPPFTRPMRSLVEAQARSKAVELTLPNLPLSAAPHFRWTSSDAVDSPPESGHLPNVLGGVRGPPMLPQVPPLIPNASLIPPIISSLAPRPLSPLASKSPVPSTEGQRHVHSFTSGAPSFHPRREFASLGYAERVGKA